MWVAEIRKDPSVPFLYAILWLKAKEYSWVSPTGFCLIFPGGNVRRGEMIITWGRGQGWEN